MSANQASFPIATMARVLGVSTAGYYAWRSRRPSARAIADDALLRRVRTIHAVSRGTYGAPRVHAELRAEGRAVGKKRVARLMRAAGIVGVSRRRGVMTTRRDRDARPAPDLVDRNFTADHPNQLWVADITYIPTAAGFLYLAVVLDAFSRRIVGWAMETHLRTELVLAALEMAIAQRKPSHVIHHSDQGTQYTALAFGARCREAGVRPSMGSVGDAYDNAMCESFFATLECELLARRRFTRRPRPGWRSSATSRGGTIPLVAIQPPGRAEASFDGARCDFSSVSTPDWRRTRTVARRHCKRRQRPETLAGRSSLLTRRWRKTDSNHRSLSGRIPLFRLEPGSWRHLLGCERRRRRYPQ
jgi:putative transposase